MTQSIDECSVGYDWGILVVSAFKQMLLRQYVLYNCQIKLNNVTSIRAYSTILVASAALF